MSILRKEASLGLANLVTCLRSSGKHGAEYAAIWTWNRYKPGCFSVLDRIRLSAVPVSSKRKSGRNSVYEDRYSHNPFDIREERKKAVRKRNACPSRTAAVIASMGRQDDVKASGTC